MLVKEDLYIVLTAGELRFPVLQLRMYLWNNPVFYFSYVKILHYAIREKKVKFIDNTYLNTNWQTFYGSR